VVIKQLEIPKPSAANLELHAVLCKWTNPGLVELSTTDKQSADGRAPSFLAYSDMN